jgi:hypothetical protein
MNAVISRTLNQASMFNDVVRNEGAAILNFSSQELGRMWG